MSRVKTDRDQQGTITTGRRRRMGIGRLTSGNVTASAEMSY